MHFWIIAIILAAICLNPINPLKESQKCRFDRVHKMIAYNCANLKLTGIPRNMKSSVEARINLCFMN